MAAVAEAALSLRLPLAVVVAVARVARVLLAPRQAEPEACQQPRPMAQVGKVLRARSWSRPPQMPNSVALAVLASLQPLLPARTAAAHFAVVAVVVRAEAIAPRPTLWPAVTAGNQAVILPAAAVLLVLTALPRQEAQQALTQRRIEVALAAEVVARLSPQAPVAEMAVPVDMVVAAAVVVELETTPD